MGAKWSPEGLPKSLKITKNRKKGVPKGHLNSGPQKTLNILDMITYISNAPVTGTPLFNLKAITETKKNIDSSDIQTDLNQLSKKLGVEIVAFKLN